MIRYRSRKYLLPVFDEQVSTPEKGNKRNDKVIQKSDIRGRTERGRLCVKIC